MKEMSCHEIPDPQSIPRGLLKHLILHLLKSENLTGAAIGRILEEKSDHEWKPSPGSIYPALSGLEEHGLVEKMDKRGRRKPYTITEKGQEFVEKLAKRHKIMSENIRIGFKMSLSLMKPADRLTFLLRRMDHIIDGLLQNMDSLSEGNLEQYAARIESIQEKFDRLTNEINEEGYE